jgi:ABC-type branched-subunit amino acid transport system substrate-binding protein
LVGSNAQPVIYHNPDVFPNTSDVANFAGLMAAKVFKGRAVTKVAIITLNVPEAIDTAVGDAKYVRAGGMKIVSNIVFPVTQTDFTSYASKIVSSGANAVMPVCTDGEAITLLAALRQQGWAGKLYLFASLETGLATATGSFGNGRVIAPNGLLVLPPNKSMLAVMKKYSNLTATEAATEKVVEGWTDAEIVAHAITLLGRSSPTAAHIKAALQSFKNWSGTFTPPITYGRGAHLDPAHCGQMVGQVKGTFVPYNNDRTVCWQGSVAPR